MLSLKHRLGAVHTLAKGGVIAYPTESVFGYGCDPYNEAAVAHLLQIKRRPVEKGMILVAANMDQIQPLLAPLPSSQVEQLQATWPGPVTWLIPDLNNIIPRWIKGRFDSVALRVSAHSTVQGLCLAWGGPVVSTSANLSGEPPARSEYSLMRRYHHGHAGSVVDYIVPGQTQKYNNPTEIRDLKTGRIIRAS